MSLPKCTLLRAIAVRGISYSQNINAVNSSERPCNTLMWNQCLINVFISLCYILVYGAVRFLNLVRSRYYPSHYLPFFHKILHLIYFLLFLTLYFGPLVILHDWLNMKEVITPCIGFSTVTACQTNFLASLDRTFNL